MPDWLYVQWAPERVRLDPRMRDSAWQWGVCWLCLSAVIWTSYTGVFSLAHSHTLTLPVTSGFTVSAYSPSPPTLPAHCSSGVEDMHSPGMLCTTEQHSVVFPKQSIEGPVAVLQVGLFPGIQRMPQSCCSTLGMACTCLGAWLSPRRTKLDFLRTYRSYRILHWNRVSKKWQRRGFLKGRQRKRIQLLLDTCFSYSVFLTTLKGQGIPSILQRRELRLREVCGLAQDSTGEHGRVLSLGLSASKACVLSTVLEKGRKESRVHIHPDAIYDTLRWHQDIPDWARVSSQGLRSNLPVVFTWVQTLTRILNPQPWGKHRIGREVLMRVKTVKELIQIRTKHPYVHCSIIYSCQDMEAAQVSISRWVDKTTMRHFHNGILLSCKKEEKFYPLRQHGWIWRTWC